MLEEELKSEKLSNKTLLSKVCDFKPLAVEIFAQLEALYSVFKETRHSMLASKRIVENDEC